MIKKILCIGQKITFSQKNSPKAFKKFFYLSAACRYAEIFSCKISVLALSNLHKLRNSEVDLILFNPPRFRALQKIKELCPNALIDMIGMKDYALIRGKNILQLIKKIFENHSVTI